MCRLFPCIPIFNGVFLLKSVKSVCICDYDKNRIVTCEKCVFPFELGYKQKRGPGNFKHTALLLVKHLNLQVLEQF